MNIIYICDFMWMLAEMGLVISVCCGESYSFFPHIMVYFREKIIKTKKVLNRGETFQPAGKLIRLRK